MGPSGEVARQPHRVVVVGGGFAGLYAAKSLGIDPEVRLTLNGRGARLITGSELVPPIEETEPPVHAPLDPDAAASGGDDTPAMPGRV